jgi:SAM-dependent methyltransferase
MGVDDLAARWRDDLAAWAIPEEIVAAAPVSPWTHQVERFARRTGALLADPKGPTYDRAREALPPGGSVLDVGAGTGAASLPLRPALLVAVDENAAMLSELTRQAGAIEVETIHGRWPEVAERTPIADVVVCSHVVFNVPDLAGFLAALDRHARRRVVVELPAVHPTSWLNPLWEHFHGLRRPAVPTADDAASIAEALGFAVAREEYLSMDAPFVSPEEMAASACRRLCLDPGRAPEVIQAARDLGVWPVPRRPFMTMWWDRTG